MRDPNLFGRYFSGASWDRWRVFLAALFGLKMNAAQLSVFRAHTGRQAAPDKPCREAWCVAGRRAGKSRVAALVAVYLAALRDWRPHLVPGEVATVMVLAADKRQARTIFRYCRALLTDVPLLRPLLIGETRETLTLSNGACIEIHAISQARTRGYSLAAALLDEACFWPSGDMAVSDTETVQALRPALATLPESMLLAISSPWSKRGVMYEQHVKHHGVDGSPVLTWLAESTAMNPELDKTVVAEAMAADEVAGRTEWGAQWREDISGYVSREQLEAITVAGRVSLPPVSGLPYVGALDAAGGSGSDSMTMAIAHAADGRAILDLVVERRPPFSPQAVAAEFSAVFTQYGVRRVQADRYAGDWPVEAFAQHGVTVEPCQRNRSECYLELLPAICAQRLDLLDEPRLLRQFLALERRATRLRDIVDHPPGGHDDLANVAAIAPLAALSEGAYMIDGAALASANKGMTRISPWSEYRQCGERWRREVAGPATGHPQR
jgi:hypothetical protein